MVHTGPYPDYIAEFVAWNGDAWEVELLPPWIAPSLVYGAAGTAMIASFGEEGVNFSWQRNNFV